MTPTYFSHVARADGVRSPRCAALFAAALLSAVTFANVAVAAPPQGFDTRVDAILAKYGVPGMAVAIVENGEVVRAKGYGVRELGKPAQVDADTIFPTGSTGKAMTTAALAILVDEGRIGWDDKVIDHLPGFQMYDPWVTREMTIRDLLVHRSGLGLGAGDLLFVPRSSRTRAETVHQLRYIKPATSFRSGYAYDNVLYVVAGELIEAVSGQTWETFVRERVLKPAGMLNSTTETPRRIATEDRAQPHARMDGGFRGTGNQEVLNEREGLGDNAAPAGGVSVSANDMAKWLQIQLAHGVLPGQGTAPADTDKDTRKRLFSAEQSKQMWTPQVLEPIDAMPPPLEATTPKFQAYALGWDVRDYRGAKIIEHGGAVFGFQTMVVLIPERDIAFALMINSEDGVVLRGLQYELLDHYLDDAKAGATPRDWTADFAAFKAERVAGAKTAIAAARKDAVPSKPALPPSGYAGKYADPWYGPIDLTVDDKGPRGTQRLRIDFKQTPNMRGTLEHWQYDTFIVRWDDKIIEPAYATFALDADGKVARITMKAVSPVADFSWDYQDLVIGPL